MAIRQARLERGVPGTPYLTACANSGKSGRASREQALRRMAIRQARLERGVPGTPYLTAWANSGKSGRASREQALRRMGIRQARLERLALSASGHESKAKYKTAEKKNRCTYLAAVFYAASRHPV